MTTPSDLILPNVLNSSSISDSETVDGKFLTYTDLTSWSITWKYQQPVSEFQPNEYMEEGCSNSLLARISYQMLATLSTERCNFSHYYLLVKIAASWPSSSTPNTSSAISSPDLSYVFGDASRCWFEGSWGGWSDSEAGGVCTFLLRKAIDGADCPFATRNWN